MPSGGGPARIDGEVGDHATEIGLVQHARSLLRRHPFALALAPFLPLIGDRVDLEREHDDFALHFLARTAHLGIGVAPGFPARDGARYAGLL